MTSDLSSGQTSAESPEAADVSASEVERVAALLGDLSNEIVELNIREGKMPRMVWEAQASLTNPCTQVYFRAGLLACREYMARFVEAQDPGIAASIRANWWPSLGEDPGPPRQLRWEEVADGGEEGPWTPKAISPQREGLPTALHFLENPRPAPAAPEAPATARSDKQEQSTQQVALQVQGALPRIREEFEYVAALGHRADIDSAMLAVQGALAAGAPQVQGALTAIRREVETIRGGAVNWPGGWSGTIASTDRILEVLRALAAGASADRTASDTRPALSEREPKPPGHVCGVPDGNDPCPDCPPREAFDDRDEFDGGAYLKGGSAFRRDLAYDSFWPECDEDKSVYGIWCAAWAAALAAGASAPPDTDAKESTR